MENSSTFDPFSQSFTLLLTNGTPFNVSIPDLDEFISYNVKISINYGAQLGGSVVVLIILALLTKKDKRTSPIFLINALSLVLNIIRNILQCLYFTGPFSESYAYFADDYSRTPRSSYAMSVTTAVMGVLLLLSVELSLILQTRVVCTTIRQRDRYILFCISIIVALLAMGFRLALCIENAEYILALKEESSLSMLGSASNITATISICWFSAVFATKLGLAIRQRRKLGLKQFGPMQIIFIMGCQTLIIPAIFSILQYVIVAPAIDSNTLTLVAIFLPLSSIWASASAPSRNSAVMASDHPRNPSGSSRVGSAGPLIARKASNGPVSPSNTEGTSGSTLRSPQFADTHDVFKDLEAQGMEGTEDVTPRHTFEIGGGKD